jgi:hypothetical protein
MQPRAQLPYEAPVREALAEARQARFRFADYDRVVRQLPGLLQRHGLGQTLAFLQLRAASPTSPYTMVLRQLDRWVTRAMAVSAPGALAALSAQDSRFYQEATAQTWLFVRALHAAVKEVE